MYWVIVIATLLLIISLEAQQVPRNLRIDCLPKPGASREKCISYGCIWDAFLDPICNRSQNTIQADHTVPLCYFPQGSGGYQAAGRNPMITLTKRNGGAPNQYGNDISPIYFSTNPIGSVYNVKIGVSGRYEPPIQLPRETIPSSESFSVDVSSTNPFAFAIRRRSTGVRIWDTSIGGLMFADKYIQIATLLPTDKIYGFGDNIHHTLKHDFSRYKTWAMFARDEPPASPFTAEGEVRKNLYGVIPFYLGLERDGRAHGVLIWNSNAQEVTTGPGPHLVYRTIGGNLDIYFFPGPRPEDVVRQYCYFVGKPFLPAYFALGFQLSRYGYKSLQEMQETVERVQRNGIPLDIPYADIDYMDRYKDFTIGQQWQRFGEYAEQLHRDALHLFLIFDPAIQVDYDSYQRGVQMNAGFIEWERADQVDRQIQDAYPLTRNSKVMLGVVWPDRHVAFPDFLDPQNITTQWWVREFQLYHQQIPFDGVWIDMNEPASFGTNEEIPWYFSNPDHPNITSLKCPLSGPDSEYDMPPYETVAVFYNGGQLSSKTVCMCGMTMRGTQRVYNTKNLYGLAETIATQRALYESTGKRGAIITRSAFPSSGHYAGHWLGDNSAFWEDLQTSVIGAQEFNIFGIPYIGSDICGFLLNTTEELCLRWHQMGAFHPFSRNHNDKAAMPQDPGLWPTVAQATREANLFRYQYLPYLYSLHFDVSLNGGTVIRPVFFEFPFDQNTHDLGYQFLWGSGMMILPVLQAGAVMVQGYLPQASWYSLRTNEYGRKYGPGPVEISALTTELIPVLARGGVIIPRQGPATTTTASRQNPFSLLITMEFSTSGPQRSYGVFYWDDGESIVNDFSSYNYFHWEMQFNVTDTQAMLTINPIRRASGIQMPPLTSIDVLGYNYRFNGNTVRVNSQNVNLQVNADLRNKVLTLAQQSGILNFDSGNRFTLTWPHQRL